MCQECVDRTTALAVGYGVTGSAARAIATDGWVRRLRAWRAERRTSRTDPPTSSTHSRSGPDRV
ncbi:MAG TPA: hypothetical protein VFO65_00885 [Acidimicrobiales bacterium]|nr:hypothetical protein [Acidimicrobiales bacterium]